MSMEAIEAYVKELQAGHDGTSQAPPLTVENILSKVYAKFYNQKGQLPFPDGLPFALKQIPSIASVAILQARITALIQAAIATRPVVTIYELENEICLAENVTIYAELGLGSSLVVLPFIRYMFNINEITEIAPVTSVDFVHFLLFDAHAHGLIASGGDANDAVLAFSRRYMNGKYKCMQLGIHVQHFPWLLQFIRQEVGKMSAFISQLQLNSWYCERNAVIYERMLTSLHTELMKRRNRGEEPMSDLKFVVHASTLEVEGSDIPLNCWGVCNGSSGGLCIYATLQAEPILVSTTVTDITPIPTCTGSMGQCVLSASSTLSSALDSSAVTLRAPIGVGEMVTCSHTRKRRRGVVVDERRSVLDITPPPPSTEQLVVSKETTAALTPVSLSFPIIPLEEVASLLRCLAVLQSTTGALRSAMCDDFFVFSKYASQLLPLMNKEVNTITVGDYNNISPSGGLFSVSVDVLLRLLSHHKAADKLYVLYSAMFNKEKGVKEGTNVPPIGQLLLKCLKMNMSEFIFLPLVSTNILLPLSAAKSSLKGRVLLSGVYTSSELLTFHPLQFILEPINDSKGGGCCGGSSLAVVDSTTVLRGLHDSNSQHESHQLLKTLEDCGVLVCVPEVWFHDGFLLRLLRSQIGNFFDGTKHDNVKLSCMALRMLLLYWWLLALWCDTSGRSTVRAAVEELLQGLRDTKWLPSLTPCKRNGNSNSDNKSWNLRIDGWHAPSDLFPPYPCFTTHGLSALLRFIPHNPNDVFSLLEENSGDICFQNARVFLDKWMTVVQRHTAEANDKFIYCKMGMPVTCNAYVALRILRSLQVGNRISLASIRYLLQCIALADDESLRCEARRCAIIPLPKSRCVINLYEDFVIGEMAAPETLCWESLPDVEEVGVLDRSISFIGDELRSFAVDILNVSPVPCVATWLAAARACRKSVMAGVGVNESLTELFLRVLSYSCVAHYVHFMKKAEERPESRENAAEVALKSVVDLVPKNIRAEYVFPLQGRWRRASEGLFFCGPYYFGFNGLALQAFPHQCNNSNNNDNNSYNTHNNFGQRERERALPVLAFPQQPHYALAALLRKMGLLALDECTEKIVTFDRINAVSSAELHRRIAQCTPRVQQFLHMNYPQYYALVHSQVRKTLDGFSVVLAAEPTLREVLRFQGHMYSMVRTIRCWYVPQHNCLYGVDEEFVASLGADAIADLFLPMMDAEVRKGVTNVLQEWMRDGNNQLNDPFSNFSGQPLSLPSSLSPSSSLPLPEEAWQLSAAPAARFRDHFPLGRDGFGPTGRNTAVSKAIGGPHMPSVKVLTLGDGGHMARSLPQWKCDIFDSVYGVLREVERARHESNSDVEEEREEGEVETNTFTSTTSATGTYRKRIRRGCRAQTAGPAMVAHDRHETADYAVAAERFVAEKLRTEVPSDVEVVWVNEHKEHGTPYDILLLRRQKGNPPLSESREILAYIEVKSTCTRKRRDFEMSLRELLFAARFGRAYKVYRVFRASTSVMQQMHVEVVEDVVKLWHTGQLSMTGQVKVMLSYET